MRKLLRYSLSILVLLAAVIWLNNTSLLSAPVKDSPTLLAHRGLGQTFTREDLDAQTCTASRIYPPEHGFIENTLPSMQAAFAAGADIVEFDIHPTTDGHFAVFHDWTLDCRTDGKGVTREHTLAELKALDIGYGYTADGGKTFPFRGKGIGAMPSLDEVLAAFPDKRFLVHIKSNDASEGDKLAAFLSHLSSDARGRLMIYGAAPPIEAVHTKLPDIRYGSKTSLKACVFDYIKAGWLGQVPAACRSGLMLVPSNIAPWLWGWPNRFLQRMHEAGVEVFILGPHDGGQFSTGIDEVQQFEDLPSSFSGGIWTNRIDRIGPAVSRRAATANGH
ncbi:glycerophosphodiester phosphodiesterase family protein [Hyphomicrobium sp. NDB2Meth4]|uniref:glycerophosphodiester phosphodiesterase family protein n=1 Tax=Hyphomicrobium sp. NDB2Meth4 TaxID=1892846 RepID=UPI000930A63C|nr:glycerophosphodiester phosphodiesterase family protein [Hyphomicrobium sp. NDB2Meth4]